VSRQRYSFFLHPSRSSAEADGTTTAPANLAGERSGISRRAFLARGSLVAGTAAVVGSVPGLSSFLSSAETESPEIGGAGPEAAGAAEAGAAGSAAVPDLGQPLVVHVLNASTGELNLYQGTAQIVARNPGLAQAIARLASRG
jgi:hypothetical protein